MTTPREAEPSNAPRRHKALWIAVWIVVSIAIVSNVFVGIYLWANAV
ncbi:hypothetical protein [Aureimonas sp. AU12]|jgi:hypothetical protein|nr:hypothetical protein [Aureimonas sp. AU12]